MTPRERLTLQNRGGGGGGEEEIRLHVASHAAIVSLANAVYWIDGSSADWCGFGCSIASYQSRSHRNTHLPGPGARPSTRCIF